MERKQSVEFFFEILNSNQFKNIKEAMRTHAYEIAEICWIDPTNAITVMPQKWEKILKRARLFLMKSDLYSYFSLPRTELALVRGYPQFGC